MFQLSKMTWDKAKTQRASKYKTRKIHIIVGYTDEFSANLAGGRNVAATPKIRTGYIATRMLTIGRG